MLVLVVVRELGALPSAGFLPRSFVPEVEADAPPLLRGLTAFFCGFCGAGAVFELPAVAPASVAVRRASAFCVMMSASTSAAHSPGSRVIVSRYSAAERLCSRVLSWMACVSRCASACKREDSVNATVASDS